LSTWGSTWSEPNSGPKSQCHWPSDILKSILENLRPGRDDRVGHYNPPPWSRRTTTKDRSCAAACAAPRLHTSSTWPRYGFCLPPSLSADIYWVEYSFSSERMELPDDAKSVSSRYAHELGGDIHTFVNPSRVSTLQQHTFALTYCAGLNEMLYVCGGNRSRWSWSRSRKPLASKARRSRARRRSLKAIVGRTCAAADATAMSGTRVPFRRWEH
jgi:hypothetical protein